MGQRVMLRQNVLFLLVDTVVDDSLPKSHPTLLEIEILCLYFSSSHRFIFSVSVTPGCLTDYVSRPRATVSDHPKNLTVVYWAIKSQPPFEYRLYSCTLKFCQDIGNNTVPSSHWYCWHSAKQMQLICTPTLT